MAKGRRGKIKAGGGEEPLWGGGRRRRETARWRAPARRRTGGQVPEEEADRFGCPISMFGNRGDPGRLSNL